MSSVRLFITGVVLLIGYVLGSGNGTPTATSKAVVLPSCVPSGFMLSTGPNGTTKITECWVYDPATGCTNVCATFTAIAAIRDTTPTGLWWRPMAKTVGPTGLVMHSTIRDTTPTGMWGGALAFSVVSLDTVHAASK